MASLTIGEVARRAGVRPSAIRYYEGVGLLPEPRRVGGQRRYDPGVLDHLAFVRVAQEAGFTVAEMRALAHHGEPDTALSHRWRALAERKLAEVDALISRAQAMKALLTEGLRCGCLTLVDCALVGRVTQGGAGASASTEERGP